MRLKRKNYVVLLEKRHPVNQVVITDLYLER